MTTSSPGILIRSFFEDHLACQKGLSAATIRSYRDALRLFLLFVVTDCGRRLSRLAIAEFTAERVVRFLNSLETQRHNHVRTRNQRLSALRTFFDYLASRIPEMLAEAERVSAIPTKRVAPPATDYLERDQIETLFARLPKNGPFARRDRALLLFLCNTGARVQEVAELRVGNLEFDDPPRVHLHGKGDKWRVCPLWPDTSQLLQTLLAQQRSSDRTDQPVFRSHQGRALTRYGIYKLVRRHTQQLTMADGVDIHHISPHSLRHYSESRTMPSAPGVTLV